MMKTTVRRYGAALAVALGFVLTAGCSTDQGGMTSQEAQQRLSQDNGGYAMVDEVPQFDQMALFASQDLDVELPAVTDAMEPQVQQAMAKPGARA
ncbi:MAG: hypothetical protein J7M25_10750 [Deltaproteobacteria bacterium]|nr:hypothetical protein [Deltaproteobacteria bacterium]